MIHPIVRFALIYAVVFAVGGRAQTVETFATFPGGASSPWTLPWQFTHDTLGVASASLLNATPLSAGSGQYLSVSTQHAASANDTQFGSFLTRTYGSAPGLDLNVAHSLSFQFRLDDLIQGGFTQFEFVGARNGAWTWNLEMGFPAIGRSTWLFLQGTGGGGGFFVDTGLTPTLGHVYEMNLTLNPVISTYTVRLDDLTAGVFASGTFNFMTTATLLPGVTEDFQALAFTESSRPDSIVYSLDNVSIRGASAVPEPATYGLLAALILVAAVGRSRGSQKSR